jgi:hypothetical protein
MGKKFDIDPGSWRIVDGKLYFNLNPTILEKWGADQFCPVNGLKKARNLL